MHHAAIDHEAPAAAAANANAKAAAAFAARLAEIERLSRLDPVMWLAQHAKVEPELTEDAGIYRMKRQAPVDTMLARQSINLRQHEAASILYRDYVLGVCGVKDFDSGETVPGIRAGFRAGNGDQFPIARIDALMRFRLAVRALGRHLVRAVFPVVCEEMTIKAVAEGYSRNNRSGLSGVFVVGLETLADHYKLPE